MKFILPVIILLAIVTTGVSAAGPKPITDLAFIDHYNFRDGHIKKESELRSMVNEIKTSIDQCAAHGVGTYILFARSFETLINYDFTVDGLGDLTNVVYPADSDHRVRQKMYAKMFNEILDYAESKHVKIIFHTNQFDFPDSLYHLAGDKMGGTARVCPGKQMGFDLLSGKIREFFTKFPKCAGIQLTVSETQVKITDCKCPVCKSMSPNERFAKMAKCINDTCKPLGKTVMIRTWGNFETPEAVSALPSSIICSTKFTLPDFNLMNYPNPVMGMYPERQEIEFDGWGEYSGYNIFPCYYGDAYADRIKTCAEKGVPRMGIRLNWEPGVRYIFDKNLPYGNAVNIYFFCRLARHPEMKADDILREYVAKGFPASARDAAFKLYKRSFALQSTWLTWNGGNCNDHSRVWAGGFDRVKSQIGDKVPDDYDTTIKQIDDRRKAIESADTEALALIDALGPDVSDKWKDDLRHSAKLSWFTANGNCDDIVVYAAMREFKNKRPMPNITKTAEDARKRMEDWQKFDPYYYKLMMGFGPGKILDQAAELMKGK